MLEQADLKKKVSKEEFHKQFSLAQRKLMELQKTLWDAGVPVVIVFEGWDASGKGSMIEKLVSRLDPRNFKVYRTKAPTPEEQFRPFLWRFATKIPGKGRMAIFDRSWYGRVLIERVDKLLKKKQWGMAYHELKCFERQLADDGYVIIKFWLHISKKEQKKRFKECEKDKFQSWKIEKEDWRHHKQYKKYYQAVEEMLEKTSTAWAPWTVVESTDRHFQTLKIFNTIIESCLKGLDQKQKRKASDQVPSTTTEKITAHTHPHILDKVNLKLKLSGKKYENELNNHQNRLRELELAIYNRRVPVVVVYEGWDAAGKGGNIKRLVNRLDPRGYEVIPISAPNQEEKIHPYLWRFWNQIPKAGHINIFDRSWYGRVLVERVEGFCQEYEWRRAYQEINEFEESLANYGTVLVKFWLHISEKEQLRRFKERDTTDYKRWKLTEEDWRNRGKWSDYEETVLDMLERTSTTYAPWIIVESEDKNWARVKSLKALCAAIEKKLDGK